jgi:hypothetical protein
VNHTRFSLKRLGQISAIAILGTSFAAAQSEPGVDVQFKLRTGLQFGTNSDGLKARTMGFGLDLGYDPGFGRFGLEVGFQYKPGDQYSSNVATFPVAAGQPAPDPAYSGDIRRNSLEGVAVRLSFEKPIPTTQWSWRLGLQLGGAKFRHEYLGDIADTGYNTYEDTYNGAATKSVIAVSPFLGTSYRFDDTSAVEFNLVGVSYTAINYVHVAGQGLDAFSHSVTKADYITEKKRMIPHIEVGYSFRF